MRKSSQEHPFCSNIIVFLIDQHIRMIRMFLKPVCLCSMKLYLATLAIFIQIHSSVRSRPSLVSVHPKIKKYLQSGNRSAVDASKPHAMEYRFRNKSMWSWGVFSFVCVCKMVQGKQAHCREAERKSRIGRPYLCNSMFHGGNENRVYHRNYMCMLYSVYNYDGLSLNFEMLASVSIYKILLLNNKYLTNTI